MEHKYYYIMGIGKGKTSGAGWYAVKAYLTYRAMRNIARHNRAKGRFFWYKLSD